MHQNIGKWLIVAGIILLIAGAIVYLTGNKLKWLGNLPGDIRIEKDNFKLYFPVTTMILLSILLTVILRIFSYFR